MRLAAPPIASSVAAETRAAASLPAAAGRWPGGSVGEVGGASVAPRSRASRTFAVIAIQLGRPRSTIQREIRHNYFGQQHADNCRRF
jgi:hypothetical protein